MFKKFFPVLRSLFKKNIPTPVPCSMMLQKSELISYNNPFTPFSIQRPNGSEIVRFYSCESLTAVETRKIRNEMGLCWKCKKNLKESAKFFCCICGTVLPLDTSKDYFSLFDMEKNFKVQQAALQKRFKYLQGLLHPDKFSLKTATEMSISEEVSSHLNHAYFTLLKPLSRALYMLELEGVFLGEDVSADDPEFLMEIMQLNEEIAESVSITDLRRINDKVQQEVDQLTMKISNAFHLKNIQAAKALIISFKYYDNILEKLKEKLPPT